MKNEPLTAAAILACLLASTCLSRAQTIFSGNISGTWTPSATLHHLCERHHGSEWPTLTFKQEWSFGLGKLSSPSMAGFKRSEHPRRTSPSKRPNQFPVLEHHFREQQLDKPVQLLRILRIRQTRSRLLEAAQAISQLLHIHECNRDRGGVYNQSIISFVQHISKCQQRIAILANGNYSISAQIANWYIHELLRTGPLRHGGWEH